MSDYSPVGDLPGQHIGKAELWDSQNGPSEKECPRVRRAIVPKDPRLAKLLNTPEQEVVAPGPGLGGLSRRTREYCEPGRGHNSTVDIPVPQLEPPEDLDIHRAKSPTPAHEILTRAESSPPHLRPSHSATISPAPTPSIPECTPNRQRPQQIAAWESRNTRPQNATKTAHAPSAKPLNKCEPSAGHCPTMWERPSRASQTMNLNVLATSRLFFSRHPKSSRLHLHDSKTSRILLPFSISYTLPRCLICFRFSCSYPLYNTNRFRVPAYFGVW